GAPNMRFLPILLSVFLLALSTQAPAQTPIQSWPPSTEQPWWAMPSQANDSAATHNCPTPETALARPIPMGVSIGNVDSILTSGPNKGKCSAGTAGALVLDANKNPAILSNNHVIAGQPFTFYGLGSVITQ